MKRTSSFLAVLMCLHSSGQGWGQHLLLKASLKSTASVPLATGSHSMAQAGLKASRGVTLPVSTHSFVRATIQNATLPPLATSAAAARVLDQATFGPTLSDIYHVEVIGLPAYLQEQLSMSPTYLPTITNPLPAGCPSVGDCLNQEWWQNALGAPDQLRQRVAFALSEMWVTSTQVVGQEPMVPYYNTLLQNSFGNWRTLMGAVTLSPAMGTYLNMANSTAGANGEIANENYAREMMQLFSLGPNLLNDDGTLQLDGNGNPIPTYTEAQVEAFARVYTGWTWANADGSAPASFPAWTYNWNSPMATNNQGHDKTAKALFNGTTLPAGQTAQQDLDQALDNIFNHPNLPPFICRQLIQHLVTGSPNPGYVARVVNVFKNNGSGVRGDMSAVIQAILLDPEARVADVNTSYQGGHLREPLRYLTGVMRGLNYVPVAVPSGSQNGYQTMVWYASPLAQLPMQSPSVFNYFMPGYTIPGTQINAPEFGLENTATTTLRMNIGDSLASNHINGFTYDASATGLLGLQSSNPDQLVSTLDLLFTHSQMSTQMHSTIVTAVNSISDASQRVRVAVYLVITSNQYKIMQ